MVADAVAPIWGQGICNYYYDADRPMYIMDVPTFMK